MNTLSLLVRPGAAIRENMEAMRSQREADTARALDPKAARARELYVCRRAGAHARTWTGPEEVARRLNGEA